MSCESYDWKAYALGELSAKDRRDAEAHAGTCPVCRGQVAEERLMLDALSTLREEEIPRRIAFVSDKVFEPRWWQSFLRPSFAAGVLIAGAILVHAFVRPPSDEAGLQARIDRAVTQMEQRDARQMEAVTAALEMIEKQNKMTYVQSVGLVRQ